MSSIGYFFIGFFFKFSECIFEVLGQSKGGIELKLWAKLVIDVMQLFLFELHDISESIHFIGKEDNNAIAIAPEGMLQVLVDYNLIDKNFMHVPDFNFAFFATGEE